MALPAVTLDDLVVRLSCIALPDERAGLFAGFLVATLGDSPDIRLTLPVGRSTGSPLDRLVGWLRRRQARPSLGGAMPSVDTLPVVLRSPDHEAAAAAAAHVQTRRPLTASDRTPCRVDEYLCGGIDLSSGDDPTHDHQMSRSVCRQDAMSRALRGPQGAPMLRWRLDARRSPAAEVCRLP